MQLKRDSPSDLVGAIKAIEDRADLCWQNLELYLFPKGLASWGVLVSLVVATEQLRQKYGYKNYDVNLINLSRRGALTLRWVQKQGGISPSDPQEYKWTPSLAKAVGQALAIASSYQVSLDCFPMWHQNMEFADLLSDHAVRFTVPGGGPAKRVSAFQKGFKAASSPASDTGLVLTAEQERERDLALSSCLWSGSSAIRYPEPTNLYRLLFPSHLQRLRAEFRRGDLIDLGPYTLGELKRAYAALNTIFSAHEDFCYRLGRKHKYPVNSCVMVRGCDEWARLIARIAGLEEAKCVAILDDLTLRERVWDLHVHPFVPVDGNTLAAAPQFPLSSRADENLLRVCGHIRRSPFDEASRMKEQEMLDDLLSVCPKGFSPSRTVRLLNNLPDIDLLLVDDNSNAVVVAELKWLRKPSVEWKERIHRKKDFEKGLRQISDIKAFLTQHPEFLHARGKLKRPLNEYQHLAFVFIARDFFLWPDRNDIIVADYDILKDALGKTSSLRSLAEKLKTYDWLPVEGKDFRIVFEPTAVNGVMIESETFYRI